MGHITLHPDCRDGVSLCRSLDTQLNDLRGSALVDIHIFGSGLTFFALDRVDTAIGKAGRLVQSLCLQLDGLGSPLCIGIPATGALARRMVNGERFA
jgi:hypothetical protein